MTRGNVTTNPFDVNPGALADTEPSPEVQARAKALIARWQAAHDGGNVITLRLPSALHQAARELAKRGIPVFPCEVGGKAPACAHGFKDSTTDRAVIDAWWTAEPNANIAVCPELAGMCVVDEDTDKGGCWPPQPGDVRNKTPHGAHIWYAGSLPPTAGKIAPHVDSRGKASYVLVSPSVVDGLSYEGDVPDRWECPDVPAWIVEKCGKAKQNAADQPEATPADWNHHLTIGDAQRDLRQMGKAKGITSAEGRRDVDAASLAGICAPYAISTPIIVELVRQYIGEIGGEEPEKGLEYTIESALGTAANNGDRGHRVALGARIEAKFKAGDTAWTGEPDVDEAFKQPAERNASQWVFRSPEEDANQPPLTYFDDHRKLSILPRLPGGCTVIAYGPRSSHKTGVVIKECLDAVFNKGACVVYFAPEGAHGIKRSRLAAACKQRGKTLGDLTGHWHTFDRVPSIMSEGEIDDFIAQAKTAGIAPDIIVLDTMTRAAGAVDISAPAVGIGLTLGMEKLAQAFDATVIAVTHPGKDPTKGSIGSSLVESLTFVIWKISFDGAVVRLYVEKMKDGGRADFTVPLKVESDGVPVVIELAPGESAKLRVHDNKEGSYRMILNRREGYGFEAGLTEPQLAGQLTHDVREAEGQEYNPVELYKTDAGKDGFADWATEYGKQLQAVRNARKEGWAKSLTEKRVPKGTNGTLEEWRWFLPEQERPADLGGAELPY